MDKKNFCVKGQDFKLINSSNRAYLEWYTTKGVTRIRNKKYGGINRRSVIDKFAYARAMAEKIMSGVSGCDSLIRDTLIARKNTFRKKSYQSYESRVKYFLEYLGEKSDRDFCAADANDFILYLFNKGKSSATVKSYVNTLSSLYAMNKMYPFRDRMKFKVSSEGLMYFDTHRQNLILDYTKKHFPLLNVACQMMYYTFLRPGELRKLEVRHIDFTNRIIRLPGSISKNGKMQPIVIPDPLFEIIKPLQKSEGKNYVFGKYEFGVDEPVGINHLNNTHRDVLKAVGINGNYSFYSWKITGAVALVLANVPMKFIQKQMRHSSLDITDKYLTKLGVMDCEELRSGFPVIGS